MPSFHQASAKSWAAIRASTHIGTYQLLEKLRIDGPQALTDLPPYVQDCLSDMVAAGFVTQEEGVISITEDGIKHLRSF